MQGSGVKPYVLKNTGGVYSCTCPAWMHQSVGIERRTCKHLRKLRGDEAERARVGDAQSRAPSTPRRASAPASASGSTTAEGATEAEAKGTAPPLLLAHVWDNDVDLTGWWMSEKLDGVRAYWNGREFISRLGNVYRAPRWFTEGLPEHALDGELWCGRKLFQRTVSIVRRWDESPDWAEVRYVVFDAPDHGGPFEARVAHCRALFEVGAPFASPHAQERCRDVAHLRAELARVESLGGEGIMLRRPGSRYEVGRSTTLLKVKSFFDAEARVVAHLAGTGRHNGRLGAVLAELPDGTRFSVGTGFSDAEREAPPPVGALITFRYQELSNAGVPRFPSFVGVRHDLAWHEVSGLQRPAKK